MFFIIIYFNIFIFISIFVFDFSSVSHIYIFLLCLQNNQVNEILAVYLIMSETDGRTAFVSKHVCFPTCIWHVYLYTYMPSVLPTVQKLIASNKLPHLLFYGPPGTGKTSTILACAKKLYGPDFKMMVLEVSRWVGGWVGESVDRDEITFSVTSISLPSLLLLCVWLLLYVLPVIFGCLPACLPPPLSLCKLP